MSSFLTRLVKRLGREASDARLLGIGTLTHHFGRLTGRRECEVRLRGVGPVTLRPAEPQLASFRRIFADREYDVPVREAEEALRDRYQAILSRGRKPVIVDAGAYVGAASLWFGAKFPQAHIVAVEPDPENFSLLERNLSTSGSFVPIQAAIGGETGRVRLVPAAESWATQVERSEAGVELITMNEAFAAVAKGEPFIAKINVEGFEADIFKGDLEWLDKVAMLFIEPHDWLLPGQHTSRPFQRALGSRDFELFIVGPHLCYVRLAPKEEESSAARGDTGAARVS